MARVGGGPQIFSTGLEPLVLGTQYLTDKNALGDVLGQPA